MHPAALRAGLLRVPAAHAPARAPAFGSHHTATLHTSKSLFLNPQAVRATPSTSNLLARLLPRLSATSSNVHHFDGADRALTPKTSIAFALRERSDAATQPSAAEQFRALRVVVARLLQRRPPRPQGWHRSRRARPPVAAAAGRARGAAVADVKTFFSSTHNYPSRPAPAQSTEPRGAHTPPLSS